MKGDTVDRLLTFGLAYLVVIGGFIALVTGVVSNELLSGAIIGFMGSALTWAFQKEVQKQTARQQERALLTTPANGYTVTASEPTTVTVEPSASTETEAA